VAGWRQAEQRLRDWNGDWVAVHVGNLGRSDRTALRVRDRALALLGLCELERGLYLRPDNLLGGVIAPCASACIQAGTGQRSRRVPPGRPRSPPAMPAPALWDGAALNRRYRDTRQRLQRWLAKADALEPEAAARESYLLGNDGHPPHWSSTRCCPNRWWTAAARRACIDTVVHALRRRRPRHLGNASTTPFPPA
jgi:phenylacetic acid degradation operon negative regulatory protein